tara:strand:+ start:1013 stop:1345 length:333 start_codon:yes stop_codon:yes gene_type:complete
MSKQSFKPNIDEDLNRPHNVTLTEGQISTILYIVEGYLQGSDDGYDPEFREDIDNIFEELEGVVDSYYETHSDNYASKVDSLIDSMQDSRNSVPVGKVSTKHQKTDLDAL